MLQPLSLLISLPVIAALVIAIIPGTKERTIHWAATIFSGIIFAISLYYFQGSLALKSQLAESFNWLPAFGIKYSLAADGLSWMLVLLTTFLMFLSMVASQSSIGKRLKLYYSMLFLIETALLGVFLSRDLFLFFLFYELELIPMYLLIAIWGGARKEYASIKFVLYTLFGSAFMFAAILGIFLMAGQGQATFDFGLIASNVIPGLSLSTQVLIFLGFFMAFCIKLPMVPFHTWLPDAHVEAPTPVSMLLAGILLKMGAYGMLRFCFAWFPEAGSVLAPYLVLFGVINIIYTAGIAMVQADLKKLIAYSSVSHMGFVLVGLGALNAYGFNGAVFQMISHGLISAGLFMIVGTIYNRTHTRLIAEMGGLGKVMPAIYFFGLFLAMASLGLPLLAGFPAESLVFYAGYLSKAFSVIPWFGGQALPISIQTLTVIAAIGVVLAAAYLLWMIQRVFTGTMPEKWNGLGDIIKSEAFVLSVIAIFTVAIGIFPNALTKYFEPEVTKMASVYAVKKQPVAEKKAAQVVLPEKTLAKNLSERSH